MTFLCKGSVEYGWEEKAKKLSPEAYAELRKKVWEGKLPETQDGIDEFKKANWQRSDIMDDVEVTGWTDAGIDVSVSRVKGLASNSKELAQTVYQVSVANVGLLQIQTVRLLEDCCTDELQGHLKGGWRILAVCPPNDARRPTYIVGHFDQEPKDR